ncbi:N-Acyltransferase [Chondrus crispus]|uniref:N-Acyltransferase n=1 Tax=Chondrus crispus TaxID=2769 RepID=R7QNK1_CHOCR|nr:N-Acyltransferase [Chondrus crispus]CDF39684.1 N-Acyltransferase [Chondrus crispus]|eukprot:XP_005709978.1 N-Acyltransferase [Chondrus crispus]
MTSAYGQAVLNEDSTGRDYSSSLPYIPLIRNLPNGRVVKIDFIRNQHDIAAVRTLLNDVIKEGMSWPFERPLTDFEFRSYFFSHTALVARNSSGAVIGAFYCKPNFPGRCAHYCNGGFITDPGYRRQGVASLMGTVFLQVAKDLEFKAVLFNLVFSSNVASLRLWEKLGFKKLARLPRVGNLREGYSDAIQYYYDLENGCREQRTNFRSKLRRALPQVSLVVVAFLAGRLSATIST